MPFACATAASIGVVMNPAIASGSAPGYEVRDRHDAVFGLRIVRVPAAELNERRPTTRIVRLTTLASTGRRMKMSVKFTWAVPDYSFGGDGFASLLGTTCVVDDDRSAVVQLHLSGRDHFIARREAVGHRHLIAARVAELHETLLDGERRVVLVGAGRCTTYTVSPYGL